MFDLDFRKNFDSTLVSRFGAPIVKIPNLNPNLRISVRIGTSHGQSDIGVSTILDFLGGNDSDKTVGLVGGGLSVVAMPTASVAAVLRVPQVSWGATSPKLSNKDLYPYFMRTIPPDSILASGMWQAIVHFEMPSVIFFYSEEPYGTDIFTTVTALASEASQAFRIKGVGLPYVTDDYDIHRTTKKVQQAKALGPKIYFLAVLSTAYTSLAYVLEQQGMVSGSWQSFASSETTVEGAPVGFLKFSPVAVGPLFQNLREMWHKMRAEDVVGPAATERYRLNELKMPFDAPPTDSLFEDLPPLWEIYMGFLFDAGYAFAFAFNAMLNKGIAKDDIKGKALLDQMSLTDFEGVGGNVKFNAEGDRLSSYSLLNTQPDPVYSNSTVTVSVGLFNAATKVIDFKPGVDIYWMVGKRGTSLPAELTACEAGHFHEEGTRLCRSCDPGKISAGGDSACERCPVGTRANAELGATACLECDPGTKAAETGRTACAKCEEGSYAALGSSTSCERCPAGTRANAERGASACLECDPGTKATETGSSACDKCEEGSYAALPRATSCNKCDIGFYQEKAGEANCTECPPHQATNFHGAARVSECMCRRGWYRTSPENDCRPCPQGMTCEHGSDLSLYVKWHDAGRAQEQARLSFPLLQEGYAALASDPLDIYRCRETRRCPGGPPGSCGVRLRVDLISCARCEDGWFWDGVECLQCKAMETSSALFPWLPIVLAPGTICLLYILFRDDLANWGSWQNGLASISFILLNHYQITKLLSNSNVHWPTSLSSYFGFWDFADDLLTVLKPECSGFGDIVGVVVVGTLTPVIVAALFCITYSASRLAKYCTNWPVGMLRDRILNVFSSLILTFFAGISEISLVVFKCHSNPNGTHTLNVDESVICGGSSWESLAVVGVSAAVVYILGCGGVFVWAIVVAPRRFGVTAFQRRWKFLFIKYRPDVYWWSIPFIMKGFALNIGFVLLDRGAAQLTWLMGFVLLYCAACIYWHPWRHRVSNAMDIYAHLCLMYVLALSMKYAHTMPIEEAEVSQTISASIICINASPLVLSAPLSYLMMREQLFPSDRAMSLSLTAAMREDFAALFSMATEELIAFMEAIGEWDRYYMRKAHHVIRCEFLGDFDKRASGRTMVHRRRDTLNRREDVAPAPAEAIGVDTALDGTHEAGSAPAVNSDFDLSDLSHFGEEMDLSHFEETVRSDIMTSARLCVDKSRAPTLAAPSLEVPLSL